MPEPSGADRPGREAVAITGTAVVCALGRGKDELAAGLAAGAPAFGPVTRFDTSGRRVSTAATRADTGTLLAELTDVVRRACCEAGLNATERACTPLLVARHADPDEARLPRARQPGDGTAGTATALASACGLGPALRTYTNACVAASTAVADAAAQIALGRADRIVVAAGYLVDADNFALFDSGRALAADGVLRPFSAGRKGLLLGDGVAAVVLESVRSARRRGTDTALRIAGWGRSGDAYHVCQPHPEGLGMARAIRSALARSGLRPGQLGYLNAHGTGTPYNDSGEAAGIRRALAQDVPDVPVSSTKSLHGHTLEASGLLELIVTALSLQTGRLPVNSGYLGADEQCELDLVLQPRTTTARHALTLNAAFGGANTALVLETR